MPVPLTIWQQWCACPGADQQRAWNEDLAEPWPRSSEPPESRPHEKERQGRRGGRKHAFRAARDAAPGMSREEVRRLYIAELRARGQDVPPEPVLDADVDLLTGHPLRGFRRILKADAEPSSDF
jgi:hypothetical protein